MNIDWHVIYNPSSGSALPPEALLPLVNRLGNCQLHPTAKAGAASEIARQLVRQGAKQILAVGGDGTLNEVLNGVAPDFETVTLGLLPCGTGNDLARYLEIPEEPEPAIARLCAVTEPRLLDVVHLKWGGGSRYFLNTSAGGFSTIVNKKMDPHTKSLLGSLAFYLSAAKALPELQTYRVQVVVENNETVEHDAIAVLVFNGRYVAGGIAGAPWSQIDDGKVDVVIVPPPPPKEVGKMLRAVLLDSKLEGSILVHRQTSFCRISATPAFSINADGEVVADTPAEYRVLPRVVKFWA